MQEEQTRQARQKDSPLPRGTVVAERYRLERVLGRGGFAIVYAAQDLVIGETVALKLFHRDLALDQRQLQRMKREIRLSRRISDHRVIRVFSLDCWRESWFLVMELVEGETLAQHLERKGKWAWSDFRPVFLEILAGMNALHAHQIIHRDIKPSNIMLIPGGGVKILDFGLAKDLVDGDISITIGEVVGTPRYISPEQLRSRDVSVRSDVFQLGMLLLTVLRGSAPSEGMDTISIISQRIGKIPVPVKPEEIRAPLPVRQGLEKALRRRPERRFSDAAAMLRYFSSSPVRAMWKLFLRRGVVAIVLGTMLYGGGFLLVRNWRAGGDVSLEVDGGSIRLATSRGTTRWEKNFSPRSVYQAFMQPCVPPLMANRSNVPIHTIVSVVLSSSETMDAKTQPSLGSTLWDGHLLQFSLDGHQLLDQPLSTLIRAGNYGFIPRGYVHSFMRNDLNGDGFSEAEFLIVHGRGMYPCALVLAVNGRTVIISSPGHISDWTIVPGGSNLWSFSLWGEANRMCHLRFFARMKLNESLPTGINSSLIPNLEEEGANMRMRYSLLTFLPGDLYLQPGEPLPDRGPVEFFRSSGSRIRVDEDGTLVVKDKDGESVYRDPRERLDPVFRDIQSGLQARDLRNDLEEAARLVGRAAHAGVENPFLQSAILYHLGDVTVRRGRFAEGRRWLRRSRALYPANRDAAQRLCETELLANGPRAALRMLDGEFARVSHFWGLAQGRDFFRLLCLLQAGDIASARIFCDRMEQKDLRNARLGRALIDFYSGGRIADSLPTSNNRMSLLYTWEEYRLLEGRARFFEEEDSERGKFCFRDVYENSRLRRHLAVMTLAWYSLKAGRPEEARRMATDAFGDLEDRSRGDLETRIWWFYDTWVFGRIMEELKDVEGARRGFSACVAANPHTDLARRAKARLSRLKQESGTQR